METFHLMQRENKVIHKHEIQPCNIKTKQSCTFGAVQVNTYSTDKG